MNEIEKRVLELLACPFCGGRAKLARTDGGDERNGYNFTASAYCLCGARVSTGSAHDKSGWCTEGLDSIFARVVAMWNRRDALSAAPQGVPETMILVQRADAQRLVRGDDNSPGFAISQRRVMALLAAKPEPQA